MGAETSAVNFFLSCCKAFIDKEAAKMAANNDFITMKIGAVADASVAMLHYQSILSRLLDFDTSGSGNGATGDTINVRRRKKLEATEYDQTVRALDIKKIEEESVPVVLDTILDVSIALTSEEQTTDLTSFNVQCTEPAVVGIAEAVEQRNVDLLLNSVDPITGAAPTTITLPAGDPDGVLAGIYDAVAALNQNMVPGGSRNLVVGTTLAALLKQSKGLLNAEKADSDDVLRRAYIGRLAGCDVYESPYFPPEQGVMLGEDAGVVVTRAMKAMGGNTSSSTFESVSIRAAIDYDIGSKTSIASWDVFYGSAIFDSQRYVILTVA